MKSKSEREASFFPIATGSPILSCIAGAILFSFTVTSVSAQAMVSLTEMGRIEATDAAMHDNTFALFQGYLSLGLLPEAASHLERRVRRMTLPIPEAATLFGVLVELQAGFDSPERLIAVCETAMLNGSRTPQVLYFYGTALRRVPGRLGEASAILGQVGPGAPYHLLALYSLGQIAAQRRELDTAVELFFRVEREAGGPGRNGILARRAARSRAEILIATGRAPEAAPVFEDLLREENNPLDRIGLAVAGTDPVPVLEQLPAEITEGLPLKERIQYLLLLGGLARESGRHTLAVETMTRAGRELEKAISTSLPSPPEFLVRNEILESLRLQIERLRSLRQRMESTESRTDEEVRTDARELLAGLLLVEWTVSRAPSGEPSAAARYFTAARVEEVLRNIEKLTLDGFDVDRYAEQMIATLQALRKVDRTPEDFRYADRREKMKRMMEGGNEIQILWEEFRRRRSVAFDGIASARERGASRLLRDLWLYIRELDGIRSVSPDTWQTTLNVLGIPRKRNEQPGQEWEPWQPLEQTVREIVAFADRRMVELQVALKTLEKEERAAAWKRRGPELIAMRPVVFRQLADSFIAKSHGLQQDPREEARKESFAALEQAVSLLSGNRLTQTDAADVALQVGLLLAAGGRERWKPFPGRSAGEKEKEMIARMLPLLPTEARSGRGHEESLYLQAALRLAIKDPGAEFAAREFLKKYPASPLSAEFGVRLGHEALLAGDTGGAVARYLAAAESGAPETSAVARYMLAWIRFQSGDVDGTARELSHPLSAPSFLCRDPSSFEQAVLALSVRAWEESPAERLDSYPPVTGGTCGGKALLTALWQAEEKRGEAWREVQVRDVAARRFPSDEGAAGLEMKTVEVLLRAGHDREALARALTLRGKYGPGSAWAQSQPSPIREKTAAELVGMLKILSERKFDEGIRTGEWSAMSVAAALMGEYFKVKGGEPSDENDELRLKWAVALLGSGDREGGVLILKELIGKQLGDRTGERAAVLYAETMIAGYERKESTAEDAEDAALLLLGRHPSEKGASLALRASAAFLVEREFGRARRVAEEVEGSRFTHRAMLSQSRLIQAEAALFEGDLAAARDKAATELADTATGGDNASTTRAKDIFLLASLQEVFEKTASGDPTGAAAILEELFLRFPDAPETPQYLLRAMRLHAQGRNGEGAVRSGLRFLKEFPHREEAAGVATVVGPFLEERKEFAQAGDLYEDVASRFPDDEVSPRILFHAGRLAKDHGPPGATERRFSAYRARYPAPAWMWTYATLSVGLAAWRRGDTKESIRLMEEGLQMVDSGMEGGFPEELAELAGKARITVGENWSEQFRKIRLVVPLDKSLAVKDRFFQKALDAFSRAESEAPLALSLQASQRTGDLLVEYGKAILSSQRPKSLRGSDREAYEEGLKARARPFFGRSKDRYAGALERLKREGGASDLAVPIWNRLEAAQALYESTGLIKGEKVE